VYFCTLQAALAWSPGANLDVTSYTLPDYLNTGFAWPETSANLAGFDSRPNTGLAISGGGTLAYSLGMGVFRGLNELGLIGNVKYLAAVSGGSWASSSFMHYGRGQEGFASSDDQFLGKHIGPGSLDMDTLNEMSTKSMGYGVTNDAYRAAMQSQTACVYTTGCVDEYSQTQAELMWTGSAGGPNEVFKALGVPYSKIPSWDATTVAEAVARNPSVLSTSDFVERVDANRPYFINCGTVVGPTSSMPFNTSTRQAWRIQYTPIYTGIPHAATNVSFVGLPSCSCPSSADSTAGTACTTTQLAAGCSTQEALTEVVAIGGMVDSFAYNSSTPNTAGIEPFGVPPASATCSAAFGSQEAMWQPIQQEKGLNLTAADFKMNKFAPTQWIAGPGNTVTKMAVSDGATADNLAIIDLVMRNITNIVSVTINGMFTALPNSSEWDGSVDSAGVNGFDPYLCALFGGCAADDALSATYNFAQNQIFAKTDMPTLVKQLQEGALSAKGPIANVLLSTVANDHWGIAAGQQVNLTVLYLAQWDAFSAALPADTQASILDGAIACNYSEASWGGACANVFPYKMPSFYMTAAHVNLVSQMFTSLVMENQDLFEALLPTTTTSKQTLT